MKYFTAYADDVASPVLQAQKTYIKALKIVSVNPIFRKRFPEKRITTVAPPNYYHSNELIQASSDKARIRPEHLEQALFPAIVKDLIGLSVNCPKEYTSQAIYAET